MLLQLTGSYFFSVTGYGLLASFTALIMTYSHDAITMMILPSEWCATERVIINNSKDK